MLSGTTRKLSWPHFPFESEGKKIAQTLIGGAECYSLLVYLGCCTIAEH